MPYYAGAVCCLAGMAVLYVRRRHLDPLDRVDIGHLVHDPPALVRG